MMRFLILSISVALALQALECESVKCLMDGVTCNSVRSALRNQGDLIYRVNSRQCGRVQDYATNILRDYCRGGNTHEGGSQFSHCINLPQLRAEALVQTNYIRSLHAADALVEMPTLNRDAQNWAEYLASMDTVETSDSGYGENVWYSEGEPGYTQTLQAQKAVNAWYSERRDWDYRNSQSYGPETGHFTQLVWQSTTQVGHGFATNDDCSKIYMTAFYNPPGNYAAQYEYNVQPAQGRRRRH